MKILRVKQSVYNYKYIRQHAKIIKYHFKYNIKMLFGNNIAFYGRMRK